MKKSTAIILGVPFVGFGIGVLGYSIVQLANLKSLNQLLSQQTQTSESGISTSVEGTQSIDDITDRFNHIENLCKDIKTAKDKGDPNEVICRTYKLAQALSEIGNKYDKSGYTKESIRAYTNVIKLTREYAEKYNIDRGFIEKSYLNVGDIYMNSKKIDEDIVKNAVFMYLNGILEEGDMKEIIIERINLLREKKEYIATVTTTIWEFYKQIKPYQRDILIKALPTYKYLEKMSKKDVNRSNWKYALQEYTKQTIIAFKTQNMISLRARKQNIRLRA